MKAIVTIPPYAPYLKEIAQHPAVEGLRLNTVMPIKEPLDDLLKRLKQTAGGKPLWLDLKTRQIRISRGTYYNPIKKPALIEVGGQKYYLDPSNPKAHGEIRTPPWSVIEIDHEIELDTTVPVKAYFSDGIDMAYIANVDGNQLLMLDGPKRLVGGGESINIMHPSLKIKGFLTDLDKQYIEAGKRQGVNNIMLSYVEKKSDITDLLDINPDAVPVAKIESEKGLAFVDKIYPEFDDLGLMAARGDLYVEVSRPHMMLNATRQIVDADPNAIAASRLFSSLLNNYQPSCQDISDIGFLAEIGYRRLMIGDDICFDEESLFSALNLLYAISKDYQPKQTRMEVGNYEL